MVQQGNQQEAHAPLNRISYWLMPVAGERNLFASLITRLDGRFGGPVFEPHITVYSGPAGSNDNPGRTLAEAASYTGELHLRRTGLGLSEKFTKTCFLNFKPGTAVHPAG